ncbi:MAG: AAA family ATPase [Elusimicrobia bacterium]|nr:AAA family ATPase [Elusimicrobiota bacterium]
MKLAKLSVRYFGALQGEREFVFNGASAVILGNNEDGKTSFLDALRTALFGLPERGKSTAEGKLFAVRYGERGFSAQAEWSGPCGASRRSCMDAPTAHEAIAKEIFLSLFLLKGGECSLHEIDKGDAGFMPKFAKAVLGSGEVDLDAALKLLQKVIEAKATTRCGKKDKALREALQEAETKLEDLGRLREACLRRDVEAKAVSELKDELDAAKVEAGFAEAAARKLQADDLASDRARWENALRDEEAGRLPARAPGLAELEDREKAKTEAERLVASYGILLKEKAAESSRLEEALSQLKSKAAGLPDKVLRDKLRESLRRWETADAAARSAGPAAGPALEWIVIGLSTAVGLALGWIIGAKAWAALAGGAVAAVLGWLVGRKLKGPVRSGSKEECEKLFEELRAVAASLKFPADARLAGERLEECDKNEARLSADAAARREALETVRQDAGRLEAELAAAKNKAERSAKEAASSLAAAGVASLKDFVSRKAKWESSKKNAEQLEASLRSRLGDRPGSSSDELKTALQRRVTELGQSAGNLPVEWSRLKRDELESRLSAALSRRDKILVELEERRKAAERRNLEAAGLRASLGGDEPAILQASHDRRRAVEDLGRLRRAAEEAAKTVRGLSSDTALRMGELVADAGPLFASLSAGRYSGLKLEGGSVFDAGALRAVHADLGARPVEWLSRGTQDLLWLSLRVAFARRIEPEGSLLVLDEPFLTLDPGRSRAAFKALFDTRWLKGWQVLVLTKDPSLKSLAESARIPAHELGKGAFEPADR